MQFDITIDERCFKTIEEFDNTWQKDKNTDEYLNEPVDTYNHCIDALRYSVERFISHKQINVQILKSISAIKSMGL